MLAEAEGHGRGRMSPDMSIQQTKNSISINLLSFHSGLSLKERGGDGIFPAEGATDEMLYSEFESKG